MPLTNHATYWWRAVATDARGAPTVTPLRPFTVFTGNAAPTAPVLVSPINNVDVTTAGTATLSVQNRSDTDNDPLSNALRLGWVAMPQSPARTTRVAEPARVALVP